MNNFNEIGLPDTILQSLTRLGLVKPTPIQSQTIPLAIAKNDVLGSAQTGTGKTLAFTLPMVKHLIENPHSTALVLAPIREIAQQVLRALHDIMGKDFKTALIIGGEPYPRQLSQLKSKPRVIIGTPGRVIDHLERGTIKEKSIDFLVLDETDRMFDMGFGIQIDHIISKLPEKRQTLMFSATIAPEIEKLAAKYLVDPKRIAVGSSTLPVPKIKQEVVQISEKEKYKRLLQELNERDGTVIVFVKTKMNADRLAEALRKEEHLASAIHGDLRQRKREQVIKAFSQGKCRIMVATDIAARGLDIPHLMHVINYDVPPCPEDYIHRIGRTGRAGAEGYALCFVTSQDARKWNAIERYMGQKANTNNNRNEGGGSSRSSKGFGDFKKAKGSPFGDKKPFGEKRRFGGEKPSFGKRKVANEDGFFSNRSDDRKSSEQGSFSARNRPDDRKSSERGFFSERKRSDDRKPSERGSFSERKRNDDRKSSERGFFSERKRADDRKSPFLEKRDFKEKKFSGDKTSGVKESFKDGKSFDSASKPMKKRHVNKFAANTQQRRPSKKSSRVR